MALKNRVREEADLSPFPPTRGLSSLFIFPLLVAMAGSTPYPHNCLNTDPGDKGLIPGNQKSQESSFISIITLYLHFLQDKNRMDPP